MQVKVPILERSQEGGNFYSEQRVFTAWGHHTSFSEFGKRRQQRQEIESQLGAKA